MALFFFLFLSYVFGTVIFHVISLISRKRNALLNDVHCEKTGKRIRSLNICTLNLKVGNALFNVGTVEKKGNLNNYHVLFTLISCGGGVIVLILSYFFNVLLLLLLSLFIQLNILVIYLLVFFSFIRAVLKNKK